METKAYKIVCLRNTEAICITEHLTKELDIQVLRQGKELIINPREMDEEMIDKDDILSVIEDACLVYEIDGAPELEEIMYEFPKIEEDDYL